MLLLILIQFNNMEIINTILISLCLLGIIFLIKNSKKMKEELLELTQKVAAQSAGIDSAITLLKGLKEALDKAINDPDSSTALKALSKEIGEKTQVLADAVMANPLPTEETPTNESTGFKKPDDKKLKR